MTEAIANNFIAKKVSTKLSPQVTFCKRLQKFVPFQQAPKSS